jgi:hypothetical protein
MIELSLSVIAWLSVVVVQAVIHYVVLGSRRGLAVGPIGEESLLEECLSLATVDTFDEVDSSFTLQDCGYEGSLLTDDPSTPRIMGDKERIIPEPELLLELLDQTGTDLFKVCGM